MDKIQYDVYLRFARCTPTLFTLRRRRTIEVTCFQIDCITEVIIERHKTHNMMASSFIDLPRKYKTRKSILNIENDDAFLLVLTSLFVSLISQTTTNHKLIYVYTEVIIAL